MTPAANDLQLVDAEHLVQMRLLTALQSAVRDGKPDAESSEIRYQLTDYCRTHFLSEELLMRLYAYPDYDDHVNEHEQMLDALDGLTEPRAIDALSALLVRHIGDRDAKLHGYLSAL